MEQMTTRERMIRTYQRKEIDRIPYKVARGDNNTPRVDIDGGGVEWEEGPCLHANVDYARGKSAMNAGALDAYAVKIVRMRYNATAVINERSRIKFDGRVYQIIPEMFHPNHFDDTLQFHMQLVVNDK